MNTIRFSCSLFLLICNNILSAQCLTCGNGIVDIGETNLTCPQDVAMGAKCTSPCGQPTPFETTIGVRTTFDFVGTTTFGGSALPIGWTFAGAPSATTSGALPAADTYGAKAGLVQPNCAGSCTFTNGFCIGNIANSSSVFAGGTGGKLGANFDGRPNIAQNLSYAVLRGQGNPTLVSPTFNFSAVEGFKLQFWLNASESSCGQSNGWGSCVGNAAYLDFSSNGGTSWAQILIMNTSSSSSDMCTNNNSNTFWIQEGTWSRVCLTVFKSTTSPGNFYPAATGISAPSGMMVNSAYFTTNFKFRIRYTQTASCTSGITTTNPGRYLAIDYPVITSGNQMIPCGISFINMCGYGADNNDDGVGSTTTTLTNVFSTVNRSPNNAERGVEILTSQTTAFASQNLTGSAFATNFDLCNAEGGDRQCIDWRGNNNFYTSVYEVLMDFEIATINLNYYKGTTPQSSTLSKVTSAGKTPTVGWRYSGNRIVSCGGFSDLNPGCNGYLFRTASLPTPFIRAFYQLAINSVGNAWSFYGPTSCSNYFNGPFFSPIVNAVKVGAGNFIVCSGSNNVFTAGINYCNDASGFSGIGTLLITGPNGFSEIINDNSVGTTPIIDTGIYTITPQLPNTPKQCISCAQSSCLTITTADLSTCSPLPIKLITFKATCFGNLSKLNWTTSSEINNDFFTIERSTDAINFEPIGTLKGAGNSNQILNYSYIDTTLNLESQETVKFQSSSTLYYRLKQTDFNGNFEYFHIEVVNCSNSENGIAIYPNPATNEFSVQLSGNKNESVVIEVFNALGQKVISEKFTLQDKKRTTLFDVNHLERGVYFVNILVGNVLETKKLVIKN